MQRNYNNYLDIAYPGNLFGLGNATIAAFNNSGGLQADSWTISIPSSPTANSSYSVLVDGASVSVTASTSPSSAQLGSDLFMAMRTSPLFCNRAEASFNGPANTITLTSRQFNIPMSVTVSGSGLTAQESPFNPPALGIIPYGRVVVRKAGFDPYQACLISNVNDQILGITSSTHAIEKFPQYSQAGLAYAGAVGINYLSGYKPLDTMNVVVRTNDIRIYVETVEDNIQTTDQPYVAIDSGNAGKITKNSSGTVPISSIAQFQQPSVKSVGRNLILMTFNSK